jgi:hypothetical protein
MEKESQQIKSALASFVGEAIKNPHFESIIDFRTAITSESDRGAALMAGAFLETEIGKLLEARLVQDAKAIKGMLGQLRPLGSFSARIETSYLVGLIGPVCRRDLNLIRAIRNDFAHDHKLVSFQDQPVSSRCRELTYSAFIREEGSPRDHFISAAMAILARIHSGILNGNPIAIAEESPPTDERRKQVATLTEAVLKEIKGSSKPKEEVGSAENSSSPPDAASENK